MSKLFKMFAVTVFLLVPVSVFAQGKIADNSKNAETNETLQITPCSTSAESVSPIKGVGVVIKKGSSSQSERTIRGDQNNSVNSNVTTSDVQKTRTKSNNANERTAQNKCIEADAVDANKPIIFKFRPMDKVNPNFLLRIYQLKEAQNYSNEVIAEKIIF